MKRNPLTPTERRALTLAADKPKLGAPIAASDPGRLEVRRATANRLAKKGWVEIVAGRVRITPDGLRVFNQPVAETGVYLKVRDGLTTRRELAIHDDGAQVIDPHTLKPFWKEQAELAKAKAEDELNDRRKHARQVSRSIRRWPTTPLHVSPVRVYFDPAEKREAA